MTNKWSDKDGFVLIVDGTGAGQSREVASNTGTRINVTAAWATNPDETTVYVLVEKGMKWASSAPASTAVMEILGERGVRLTSWNSLSCADFVEINEKAHEQICAPTGSNLKTLRDNLGDPTEIRVPCLFQGELIGGAIDDCEAWFPGMVNMLVVESRNIIPWPFGPNDGSGDDLYWEHIETALPGTLKSLNDWYYHTRQGEVHCGTNTKRTPPDSMKTWWDTWKDK